MNGVSSHRQRRTTVLPSRPGLSDAERHAEDASTGRSTRAAHTAKDGDAVCPVHTSDCERRLFTPQTRELDFLPSRRPREAPIRTTLCGRRPLHLRSFLPPRGWRRPSEDATVATPSPNPPITAATRAQLENRAFLVRDQRAKDHFWVRDRERQVRDRSPPLTPADGHHRCFWLRHRPKRAQCARRHRASSPLRGAACCADAFLWLSSRAFCVPAGGRACVV